ncbi:MAG: hypothetical protein ACLT3Y_00460 [Ruminococcus callidus]
MIELDDDFEKYWNNNKIKSYQSIEPENPTSIIFSTESMGASVDKITEIFRLYDEIGKSLIQSIKNVLSTVEDVQNGTDAM